MGGRLRRGRPTGGGGGGRHPRGGGGPPGPRPGGKKTLHTICNSIYQETAMRTRARLQLRRRSMTVGVAVLALAASGVVIASAATPPPAHLGGTVGLRQVGPIDQANGYPMWYKDTSNTRLELCLDPSDPNCIIGVVPDPTKPVSFPDNFPDEAFYSSADANVDVGNGTAKLVTGVEAAFAGAGNVAKGQQITFGRIRVVAKTIPDGNYTVTHPFGVDTYNKTSGGIFDTQDIGALTPDGVFDQTLGSRPGPFLKWDPAVAPAAPTGYLGDVTVGHPVVGSPYNTNYFRIEGPVGAFTGSANLCSNPALGASPTATTDCVESSDFFVHGKKATRAGVQV